MPYITEERREKLKTEITKKLNYEQIQTAGELNYAFTIIMLEYIRRRGKTYQTLNDVLGALEGAKLEIYRRVAAPFEDQKAQENGDVF